MKSTNTTDRQAPAFAGGSFSQESRNIVNGGQGKKVMKATKKKGRKSK